jgi:hypothetical protein
LGLELDEESIDQDESTKSNAQWLADSVKNGMEPIDLAKLIFNKILDNEFWILSHPEFIEVYKEYSKEIFDLKK